MVSVYVKLNVSMGRDMKERCETGIVLSRDERARGREAGNMYSAKATQQQHRSWTAGVK
jgi:hypothetical protein